MSQTAPANNKEVESSNLEWQGPDSTMDSDLESEDEILSVPVELEVFELVCSKLPKVLGDMVCEYAAYWIKYDEIFEKLSENIIRSDTVNSKNDNNSLIDQSIVEIVFIHNSSYEGVETTRKVKLVNHNNQPITFYRLHNTLRSLFKEWLKYFSILCHTSEHWYDRYHQDYNEDVCPSFRESKVCNGVMTIPLTITAMYGLLDD